jgi:hypothetical protein
MEMHFDLILRQYKQLFSPSLYWPQSELQIQTLMRRTKTRLAA